MHNVVRDLASQSMSIVLMLLLLYVEMVCCGWKLNAVFHCLCWRREELCFFILDQTDE
jgi:hypothetical protein